MDTETDYTNFYEKYKQLDKSRIVYDIKEYESRCQPNTIQVEIEGLNAIQLRDLRHIAYRDLHNLSIEYIKFNKYDTDMYPEKIALKLQNIPLHYNGNYQEIVELDGYLQCNLSLWAETGPTVVYPDMIDFETYNTPLEIPIEFSRTPLFILNEGEHIDIHCYISKGLPKTNVRWSSVNTFKYTNKFPDNVYSDKYVLYIETDGSIKPEILLEECINLL